MSTTWGTVLTRIVVTATVLVGVVGWTFFALLLAMFRCDENCSGDQYGSWQYTGQFVLAAIGCCAGLAALATSITRFRRTHYMLLALALGSLLVWLGWLSQGTT